MPRPDKPGPDYSAEVGELPIQPSEDAEAPHEGAGVQQSVQTLVPEAVPPPTRRQATDKQKGQQLTVTARSKIATLGKNSQPEAGNTTIRQIS